MRDDILTIRKVDVGPAAFGDFGDNQDACTFCVSATGIRVCCVDFAIDNRPSSHAVFDEGASDTNSSYQIVRPADLSSLDRDISIVPAVASEAREVATDPADAADATEAADAADAADAAEAADAADTETLGGDEDENRSRLWTLSASALDLDRDSVCMGPPLSLFQRWSWARSIVLPGKLVNLALVFFMSQAYAIHAGADPILAHPIGVSEAATQDPDRLQNAINLPPESIPVIDSKHDRLKYEKLVCSYLFLVLGTFFVLRFLIVTFAWRRARRPPTETARPKWPAPLSMAAMKKYVEQWVMYKWYVTRPGTTMFWLEANALHTFEVILQFLQLCAYGGFDVYSFSYIPAMDDRIVLFQACLVAADMWFISVSTFFGLLRCQIVWEVVVQTLYAGCTVLALGGLSHQPSWTVLVNPEAFWQTFFTTCYACIIARHALDQLDLYSLQLLSPQQPPRQHSLGKGWRWWSRFRVAQVIFRPCLGIGILTWAAAALTADCSVLTAPGWVCAYITHPLFESPSCNCRALYFLPDLEQPCNVESFVGISNHATTVQYFGVVGAAGSTEAMYCNLDDDLLSRINPDFFQYALQVFVMFAEEVSHFPALLASATDLRKIQWIGGNITTIPRSMADLSQLSYMAFTLNPVCFDPVEYDFWSRLMRERYDPEDAPLTGRFTCLADYDIDGVVEVVQNASAGEPDANGTNGTNTSSSICTPDGLAVFQALKPLFRRCVNKHRNETSCVPGCTTVAAVVAQHDTEEPFGALDYQEAMPIVPSLGFPNVTFSHFRCVIYMSQCQEDDRLSEEQRVNYVWLSTATLLGVRSRCADCDGFISLENQVSV